MGFQLHSQLSGSVLLCDTDPNGVSASLLPRVSVVSEDTGADCFPSQVDTGTTAAQTPTSMASTTALGSTTSTWMASPGTAGTAPATPSNEWR